MRVLVVGGGAREHAIALTLHAAGSEIHVLAGHENPGLSALAARFDRGDPEDAALAAGLARRRKVELAVIGPEGPLASGVPDALRAAGVPVVGPSREAARIESSKQFCRELLARHHVPGQPRFVVVSRPEGLDAAVGSLGGPFVIKPVGLTGGKGVL